MIELSAKYRWEAELSDGQIISKGDDLRQAVRFSLIPTGGAVLPQHDLAGVAMIRRFGRGFQKVHFNSVRLEGLFFWENGSSVLRTEISQVDKISPGDLISKGVDGEKWYVVKSVFADKIILLGSYIGKSKPKGMQAKMRPPAVASEYLHCVVCEHFRLYVRSSDGAALIAPVDYELYL